MRIKPLLEKLRHNWPVKALCVVIACLFYLFNRYTSLEQKSVPVTLKVLQDGEMVSSTHIPSSVSVTIRTSAENITKITAENILAQLDLSWINQEGDYDVPISIDLPSNIVEMNPLQVTVYPEKVKVHLERNFFNAVKIAPQFAGTPLEGYVVDSYQTEPEYISIYGPRSIVQSVESITTEPIVVEGKRASFKQKAKLMNINRMIKVMEQEECELQVNIDYQDGIQEFPNLSVFLKNIPAAFECESKATGSITLKGPRLIMEDWTPNPDTLSADLGEITEPGEYTLPVSVLIPQEFHLESVSIETIRVVVKERPPAEVVDDLFQGAVFNQTEGGQ
ncbi:MAG: YbbR-like domain-containing protein [Treponema sp.]|nr:YbbR-like domain-containing protein [Treponema sp.]